MNRRSFIIALLATPATFAFAAKVKKYKVTLSKSDKGSNRTVYIDAQTSDEARKTARDQNPGWRVEAVSEVTEK